MRFFIKDLNGANYAKKGILTTNISELFVGTIVSNLSVTERLNGTIRFTNPLDLTSVLPFTLLLDTLLADISTDTVLFASLPFADIFATILPNEGTMTFTFVIYKLATVHFTILPLELALTIHFILAPVTGI